MNSGVHIEPVTDLGTIASVIALSYGDLFPGDFFRVDGECYMVNRENGDNVLCRVSGDVDAARKMAESIRARYLSGE